MKEKCTLLGLCLTGMILLATETFAAPALRVEDRVWNVGRIVDNTLYTRTVALENVGDEPLVIESIEECCGFYAELPANLRLLPGESAPLLLKVKTFKMIGDLNAEIVIVSNDPRHPRTPIAAVGQVVPKQNAAGELAANSLDLGVVDLRDRIPFQVRLRSTGNETLEIVRMEKATAVFEKGSRPRIPPGEERVLEFEYVPGRVGPIDDRLEIVTNDALKRSLVFQLQGYVSQTRMPTQALAIYPVGHEISYEPTHRGYRYDFTISNRSPREVEVLRFDSSLPVLQSDAPDRIEPGQEAGVGVTFQPKPGQVPGKGFVYLLLAIPVEVR